MTDALIILNQKTTAPAVDRVALPYDQRKRSRLRVTLDSGREAGIFLPRGEALRGGDHLAAEHDPHLVVAIAAAPEALLAALAPSPLLFARAAYHLGNRHVPVEILPDPAGGGRLHFQTDHVLADMVRGLGCTVEAITAPFQPEAGAYGHHGHSHGADEPSAQPADPAGDDTPDAGLHDPGHGPHRSVPRIHQFGENQANNTDHPIHPMHPYRPQRTA